MTKSALSLSIPALTALLLTSPPAPAAITYVDAEEGAAGNTFATGGSLANTSWSDDNAAGEWQIRAFGNNSTIFEANNNSTIELTTQLSGLADGTYDIWVFFWDQITSDENNWVISAGFTSGNLNSYSAIGEPLVPGSTQAGVSYAGDLTFSSTPLVDDLPNRQLFGANIGQAVVSGGSTIEVFVDNYLDSQATGGGSFADQRTWYDGVGYELVPEPSSTALLALTTLALLRRRRS